MAEANPLQIALAALHAIANPIKHLQDQAKAEGSKLDGLAALNLANDAGWLRVQARDALQQIAEAEEKAQSAAGMDQPSSCPTPARGCVHRGNRKDMERVHTDLLREMLRTHRDITHSVVSQSGLAGISIGFSGDIVKCLVLTTYGSESVTARVMLCQEPEVLGLVPDTADAQRVTMALSCHNCRRKTNGCPYRYVRDSALEYGSLRSCASFDVNDSLVVDLARIIQTLPATELSGGRPS